jgi:hypothetical protein
MLSVRILGDGGWQLLQVGPWLLSSPPPPHLRSLLEIYLCTVLGIVHCILTGPAEAAFAPHSGVAAKFPRKKHCVKMYLL